MKIAMGQVLVHFCSLLVAVPVGWCCWLPDLRGSEPAQVAECCHCAKNDKKAPATPNEQKPAPVCCCDPQPATLRTSSDQIRITHDDALPAFVAPTIMAAAFESDAFAIVSPTSIDASPPLHVLHCVWLC